ncbi:MAG: hypothetical protein Q8Q42_04605 [Nanoarchaeota archaeon]|nr:hypothetical protein [Nanoarchaeota archaeon]
MILLIFLDKKGQTSSGQLANQLVLWPFYTVVIAVAALIIVISLSYYLNRDVQDHDLQFLVARNYIEKNFVFGGETSKKDLTNFEGVNDLKFGVKIQAGNENYFANRKLYDDYDLCGISNSPFYCSDEMKDFYLVDGELKIIKINMVAKYE